jgi:hypothetical protein
MSVFVDRYLGRTRAAEHLVEDWSSKQDRASVTMDVEEMIRECDDLSGLCRHAWQTLWQLLRRDPNGAAVAEAEVSMKKALSKTLQIFKSVEILVANATQKGCVISNSGTLTTALQAVQEISAKVEVVYPKIDEVKAAEAAAAFHRGECVPIEDLIREAQSGRWPGN